MNKVKEILIVVMFAAIVYLAFCNVFNILNTMNSKEWNNGICTECKTLYELHSVYGVRNNYICPECGKEITRYMY